MSRTSNRADGDIVQDFLPVADLLEEPQLARLYAYLVREGEATVQDVMDDLELAQGTAYSYVNRLVDERDVSDTDARRRPRTPRRSVRSATHRARRPRVTPSTREREACSAAVYAARDVLREHGPATKRDLVAGVMPDHPLGYDVDGALEKVEASERYRGAWWRRVVKPGLKTLPDVEAPARGASEWDSTNN